MTTRESIYQNYQNYTRGRGVKIASSEDEKQRRNGVAETLAERLERDRREGLNNTCLLD